MNRWTTQVLLACSLFVAGAAWAQTVTRTAPADVKPAIIAVSATPPDITVNGEPARLSPGARIRDTNNLLVLSGALAGKSVYTVYRKDSSGLVHEVWLLTPAEYEKVGGQNVGDPEGYKRFNELLALIFNARALLGR
jgi:hypothetical protein